MFDGRLWRSRVRAAGLRVTRHRLEMLKVLEVAATPRSHGELVDALPRGLMDRTTAFRNLMALTRAGLVERLDGGDRLWRYALSGRRSSEAVIFECVKCASRVLLPPARVSFSSGALPEVVRRRRFQLRLRGVCDLCN